jgi:hypothetical protein
MQAHHDPTEMRNLIEESRDAFPAHQQTLHGATQNAL